MLRLGWSLVDSRIDLLQSQLVTARQVLSAYDPRAVLERGYAIVRGEISVGSELTIEQKQQIITAEVTHVESK